MARDGEFGQHLVALLESGPEPGPDVKDLLVRRWSPQNEFISGYDLCDTLLKTWKTQAHSPDFHNNGSAWWMFRNPRYDVGAPERVVEHLLLAARGGAEQPHGDERKGALVEARNLGAPREPIMASIDGLPPGAYSIDVGGTEPGTSLASVSSDILIWERLGAVRKTTQHRMTPRPRI